MPGWVQGGTPWRGVQGPRRPLASPDALPGHLRFDIGFLLMYTVCKRVLIPETDRGRLTAWRS